MSLIKRLTGFATVALTLSGVVLVTNAENDKDDLSASSLCDHVRVMRSYSFEMIRDYLVAAKDEYYMTVRDAGTCRHVGYGVLKRAVKEALLVSSESLNPPPITAPEDAKQVMDSIGDGASTEGDNTDHIGVFGQKIDRAIGAFKAEVKRLLTEVISVGKNTVGNSKDSGQQKRIDEAQKCADNLREYSKQLHMWRNFLFSFGVAITASNRDCEQGLDDTPLMKEATMQIEPYADLSMCERLLDCIRMEEEEEARKGREVPRLLGEEGGL